MFFCIPFLCISFSTDVDSSVISSTGKSLCHYSVVLSIGKSLHHCYVASSVGRNLCDLMGNYFLVGPGKFFKKFLQGGSPSKTPAGGLQHPQDSLAEAKLQCLRSACHICLYEPLNYFPVLSPGELPKKISGCHGNCHKTITKSDRLLMRYVNSSCHYF